MSEEEKDVTTPDESEEEEQDVDADEPQEGEEGSEDPESEGKSKEEPKDEDIDWKKVAEDERKKREKAEKKLAGKRFSERRKEEEKGDEEYDDEEDKPLTKSELRAILAEDRKAQQKEFLATRIQDEAKKLAGSDEEAEAIIEIFNNRSFPDSMTLEQQIQEAYFIAHGPRILAKTSELRRSLKSKKTKKNGGTEDARRDAPLPNEPKLSPADKAEMSRTGFAWNGKAYVKKLASGRTLVRDPKTKKVYIQ